MDDRRSCRLSDLYEPPSGLVWQSKGSGWNWKIISSGLALVYTTGKRSVAVRGARTAKGRKRTAKPLPCVDARQRAHDNAIFAVHRAIYARQRPLPCLASVAVRIAVLPCKETLPCAGDFTVRGGFVVRYGPLPSVAALPWTKSLPCVMRCRASTPTLCRVPPV
jgi:hypothetical protein